MAGHTVTTATRAASGCPLLGLIPPTGWWDSPSFPHPRDRVCWILGTNSRVHQDVWTGHLPHAPFTLSFILCPFARLFWTTPRFTSLGPQGAFLTAVSSPRPALPVCHLTMLFFRLLLKVTRWLLTLLLINPFYDIFQQLGAIYLRWNPASGDSSMLSALRTEYAGLERLIDDRTSLISPLSRNMHLGSSTMDEIVTIVRSSSIGGADTLVRTLLHLSAEATDIGKDLQAYSASIDSTVDE